MLYNQDATSMFIFTTIVKILENM